ncbi:cytochrome P450 [Dolichospermum compactum]|uniref:Cytochrome P450 n=1 Tax=Dolichospermum compactum NIES-806 TaxID=1973481 RepID=A0A1Z4V7G3_9CYAN|nr:cytochrome P450 [Dolichospermum compactum]BAZ87491.1 cytochrome P450 [Dolichospermum compactum NIES-806]
MKSPENKSNNPNTSTDNQLPLPPGNLGLPIIGETISFVTDKNFIKKRQEKYGNVFKTNIIGRPTIIMIGSDANRFIFSGDNRNFIFLQDKNTSDLLGPASLAMQTGSIHQTRRKLLAQAFQTRALASYTPAMLEITNSYLRKWKDLGQLTLYPQLREYAFDIACKLLVGTDITNDHDFLKLFEAWCQGLHALPIRLPWTTFSKAVKSREMLLAKIDKIIVQRQKQPNSGNSEKDALDLLLNAEDENIYQNPQSFDPERFSVERNEDKSKPFSYIPFGGGIKECLGKEFAKLEMKIFTALLLRGYELELVPGQNLDSKMTPTPQESDGLKIFLRFNMILLRWAEKLFKKY